MGDRGSTAVGRHDHPPLHSQSPQRDRDRRDRGRGRFSSRESIVNVRYPFSPLSSPPLPLSPYASLSGLGGLGSVVEDYETTGRGINRWSPPNLPPSSTTYLLPLSPTTRGRIRSPVVVPSVQALQSPSCRSEVQPLPPPPSPIASDPAPLLQAPSMIESDPRPQPHNHQPIRKGLP